MCVLSGTYISFFMKMKNRSKSNHPARRECFIVLNNLYNSPSYHFHKLKIYIVEKISSIEFRKGCKI